MSAYPDDPTHFVRWLGAAGVPDAAAQFVPRLSYGRYLREQLDQAAASAGDRLRIVSGEAADIVYSGAPEVRLTDGRTIAADAAVLAIGNLPPHHLPGLDPVQLGDCYRADPWAPRLADGLSDHDTILIVGTGLTMVDIALSLDAHGFRGQMVAISRRGLVPHRHAATPPVRPLTDRPPIDPAQLLRSVRRQAGQIGWRGAVDALRPMTQILWRSSSNAARRRFLRHLRPWWDIHRHRLAPQVADRLQHLIDSGRLRVVAGKPIAYERVGEAVVVAWRPRGSDNPERLTVRRIINCTGPQGDLMRSDDPLLAKLRERGLLRPDSARLGIDVGMQAQIVDAQGRPSDWLFAIGPMTRGAFWEIVAVPDIRTQAWTLARRLSNAHWVEAEGL